MTPPNRTSARPSGDASDPGIAGLDRSLVDLLKQDGRMSYADLGASVGLSGDAVRERLKRLEGQGKIQITGMVSPAVVGYKSFALVGLRVRGASHKVAEVLAEVPWVDLVVCVAGRYDVLVQLVCRDDDELLSVLDGSIRSIDYVEVAEVFPYLTFDKYGAGSPEQDAAQRPVVDVDELDAADHAIIRVLQLDGRASYRELEEASGLTYTSTRRRVRSLLDSGVVRIVTVENPLALRPRVEAAVGVCVSGPVPPVRAALLDVPEVKVAVSCAGSFDLLLEVSCADKAGLAELTTDRLRRIKGVQSSETFQYLARLKDTWAGLEGADTD